MTGKCGFTVENSSWVLRLFATFSFVIIFFKVEIVLQSESGEFEIWKISRWTDCNSIKIIAILQKVVTKLKGCKNLNNQLLFSTVNPHLPVIGYATNLHSWSWVLKASDKCLTSALSKREESKQSAHFLSIGPRLLILSFEICLIF